MLSPQPADFCTQCQAPIYWMRDKYHFTCLCMIGTTASTHIYAIETRECGNSFLPGHPPGTPQIAPQSLTVPCTRQEDEITHARAVRVYQELFKAIYEHASTCSDCDTFSKIDMICPEQTSLWRSLRWWGRRMETEENLSA
ncbi:MAG: hypothetical protein AUF65_01455 [Chloroflexi bacterium 13_1_20CM_50_12]|nr:MAG: hypothetical protein AUF65_01455 [Chloroflexi bacterium 13_1_20CM_50_12]